MLKGEGNKADWLGNLQPGYVTMVCSWVLFYLTYPRVGAEEADNLEMPTSAH